jgi:hypothetical protein
MGLATSAAPGTVTSMDGPPLVLHRRVTVVAFMLGATPIVARAGTETPSFREQAACHKHREANEHVQAAERCLAAYDALPDAPEALEARAVMAFDAGYSFRDAYAQTGEVKHLCGEIRMMIRFLNYLDHHVAPGERPYDRRDAQKSLDAARDELGNRSCTIKPPEPEPEPELAPEPASASAPSSVPTATVPATTDKVDVPASRPRLKIAGWTLFALSLGFGVWTSAELALGEVSQAARDNLLASVPDAAAPDSLADQLADLKHAGAVANQRAIIAGSLGAASFITGVTLLAVDAHRRKQRRLSLIPVSGPIFGARLRLEF